MLVELWFRDRITVNTDPQRRCYNGVNFSEVQVWTAWGLIGPYSRENAESSAATFKKINPSREYEIRPLDLDTCAYRHELAARYQKGAS